jgi:nitronate monooxygenase
MAPLRAKAEAQGVDGFTSLWSGQNPSGCAAVPAAEITRRLAEGLPR